MCIDVVSQYSFGFSNHRLESDGFDPKYHNDSYTAGTCNAIWRNMNWIMKIMNSLPENIAEAVSADMSVIITLKRENMDRIDKIRQELVEGTTAVDDATIFHGLLRSNLPDSEKQSGRLAEEAILLLGAGTHTGSWALSVATYNLLSQLHTLQKLKKELEAAIPDPSISTPLSELEKLP
jgi:hypothetical protein